jgi:hypothetical protein
VNIVLSYDKICQSKQGKLTKIGGIYPHKIQIDPTPQITEKLYIYIHIAVMLMV